MEILTIRHCRDIQIIQLRIWEAQEYPIGCQLRRIKHLIGISFIRLKHGYAHFILRDLTNGVPMIQYMKTHAQLT